MQDKKFFINGIGLISPQQTFNEDDFLEGAIDYQQTVLNCITPDFKQYINPIQLRRLSRIQRIGLAAAAIALKDIQPTSMLGVVTATGGGSSSGKGTFITEVLLQNEKQIAPTSFVQSSYNNLAGLVGMTYRMMGYNNNFVSGGSAFETAMQDAILQLIERPSQEILVGSYDESHIPLLGLDNRTGHFKNEEGSSLQLFSRSTPGTIWGEGASFFRLSTQPAETTLCKIGEPLVFHRPAALNIVDALNTFLAENNIDISSIDVLVSGASGDINADKQILEIEKAMALVALCRFKHLCGEYFTSVSFGVWLAASILKKNKVPASTRFNAVQIAKPIKKVLVANHYRGQSVSFILLEI